MISVGCKRGLFSFAKAWLNLARILSFCVVLSFLSRAAAYSLLAAARFRSRFLSAFLSLSKSPASLNSLCRSGRSPRQGWNPYITGHWGSLTGDWHGISGLYLPVKVFYKSQNDLELCSVVFVMLLQGF